jgi:hypothetical protein
MHAAFRPTDSMLIAINQKKMHVGGIYCALAKASDYNP